MVKRIGITEFFLLHALSLNEGQQMGTEEKLRYATLMGEGVFEKCVALIRHKQEQRLPLTAAQQLFYETHTEACKPVLRLELQVEEPRWNEAAPAN